jgi:hypothetical protein
VTGRHILVPSLAHILVENHEELGSNIDLEEAQHTLEIAMRLIWVHKNWLERSIFFGSMVLSQGRGFGLRI